jgi:hypothetical protein
MKLENVMAAQIDNTRFAPPDPELSKEAESLLSFRIRSGLVQRTRGDRHHRPQVGSALGNLEASGSCFLARGRGRRNEVVERFFEVVHQQDGRPEVYECISSVYCIGRIQLAICLPILLMDISLALRDEISLELISYATLQKMSLKA